MSTKAILLTRKEAASSAYVAFAFSHCDAHQVANEGDIVEVRDDDNSFITTIPPGKLAIEVRSDLSLTDLQLEEIAQAGYDTAQRIGTIS